MVQRVIISLDYVQKNYKFDATSSNKNAWNVLLKRLKYIEKKVKHVIYSTLEMRE